VIASAHLKSLLILVVAILLEVAGTTCMKLSNGFTRLVPSIAIFALYGLSLSCFTVALKGLPLSVASAALKGLPLSVASAVWSGVGTSLVAIIGFTWFKEPVTFAKVAFIVLILVGVIGLNLVLQDRVQ
jgi:small multidrug resistance pump